MTNTAAIRVRSAQAGDLDAIQRIYAAEVLHGTASFETEPPDIVEITGRWRRLTGDGYPWLVAWSAGEILGYAYAGPYRPRTAYRYTVENSVYVAAPARRRGVGRALLRALIGECEAGGYRQMIAIIGDSAHVASIELHRRLGFRMVGTLTDVGYKFDSWLDSVLMQRSLIPPAESADTRISPGCDATRERSRL